MGSAIIERHIRVLLVDDCKLIRQLLVESMVRLDSVEVVGEASNSQQGIDLFQILDPDVLIVDIKMPGGNGFRLLEAMQDLDHDCKVIVLTNYPHEIYRKRCMALGAEFFFEKASEYHKIEEVLMNLKFTRDHAPT